jgi:hypothetical protein
MSGLERIINDTIVTFANYNVVPNEDGLTLEIIPMSDCCGEYMRGLSDYGICPRCGEHCEIVNG